MEWPAPRPACALATAWRSRRPRRRQRSPRPAATRRRSGHWIVVAGSAAWRAERVRTSAEGLPPRTGRGFARGRGRLAAARRWAHGLRLDHLAERGAADLEIDVTVRF